MGQTIRASFGPCVNDHDVSPSSTDPSNKLFSPAGTFGTVLAVYICENQISFSPSVKVFDISPMETSGFFLCLAGSIRKRPVRVEAGVTAIPEDAFFDKSP